MILDRLVAELRKRLPQQADGANVPQAAVALLLAPDPDQLLLIRRADREGDPWSGHLALPGGRWQANDRDLMATAIRETEEETGIRLRPEWCRAQLDDLVPRTPVLPPVMVRPFVFLLDEARDPGVSQEVVRSTWLPLEHMSADGVYAERTILVRGQPLSVPGYQLAEGFLWGMTERILSPVLNAWKALVIESGQT
jgi:8-oxo-dGTP pyrophosphatase MutT (NUDIX family)